MIYFYFIIHCWKIQNPTDINPKKCVNRLLFVRMNLDNRTIDRKKYTNIEIFPTMTIKLRTKLLDYFRALFYINLWFVGVQIYIMKKYKQTYQISTKE